MFNFVLTDEEITLIKNKDNSYSKDDGEYVPAT